MMHLPSDEFTQRFPAPESPLRLTPLLHPRRFVHCWASPNLVWPVCVAFTLCWLTPSAHADEAFVAFKADDPSNTLWVTSSNGDMKFPAATPSPDVKMDSPPAMAVPNNRLDPGFPG